MGEDVDDKFSRKLLDGGGHVCRVESEDLGDGMREGVVGNRQGEGSFGGSEVGWASRFRVVAKTV